MLKLYKLISVLAMLATFSCVMDSSDDESIRTMTVLPYLSPWHGFLPGSAMMIEGKKGPEVLGQGINGFTFTWGKKQVLQVLVRELKDPPMDASNVEYTLKSVLKTTIQDSVDFPVYLYGGQSTKLELRQDTLWIEGYEYPIYVPENEKGRLESILEEKPDIATVQIRWTKSKGLRVLPENEI